AQRNRQLYRRQSTSHRLRLAPHPSHTNRSAKAESSPRTLDDSPAERAERRSGVHAGGLALLHLGPDPARTDDIRRRCLGGGILYDSMDRSCTFRVSGESHCVQLGPAGYSSSVSSLELHFIFSKRANRPRRTNSNRVSC